MCTILILHMLGFIAFLFYASSPGHFLLHMCDHLASATPKEKIPTIPVCEYCPLFWPDQIHRVWPVPGRFLPHHHHHRSSVLFAPSGLTSCTSWVGIITGNPGVFQGYPYPYPRKPVPAFKGRGFGGLGTGFRKNPGVLQPMCGYASKTD